MWKRYPGDNEHYFQKRILAGLPRCHFSGKLHLLRGWIEKKQWNFFLSDMPAACQFNSGTILYNMRETVWQECRRESSLFLLPEEKVVFYPGKSRCVLPRASGSGCKNF
jgi:hypothetical protein